MLLELSKSGDYANYDEEPPQAVCSGGCECNGEF